MNELERLTRLPNDYLDWMAEARNNPDWQSEEDQRKYATFPFHVEAVNDPEGELAYPTVADGEELPKEYTDFVDSLKTAIPNMRYTDESLTPDDLYNATSYHMMSPHVKMNALRAYAENQLNGGNI
jgi:hypothetical protein